MTAFDFDMLLRLVVASILGAVIGLEREVRGRSAGFRTHLLVSLGSCLYVLISIDFYKEFGNFSGSGPVGVDPARIAAQVVTGIGFLGAGAIIREKASIRGLTTAACLWVAAAIGVACGSGHFTAALVVTLISFVSLLLLKKLEIRLKRDIYMEIRIWSSDLEGQLSRLQQVLSERSLDLMTMSVEKDIEKKKIFYRFHVRRHSTQACADVAELFAGIEGVNRVSIE